MTAQPLSLSDAAIERAKQAAWSRYASYPHADTSVGWDRYLAELREIERLAEVSPC